LANNDDGNENKIPILFELTVKLVKYLPADFTEGQRRFFIEEHFCHQDAIIDLAEQIEKQDENICTFCGIRSEAKYIGLATAQDLERCRVTGNE
jgi:hypothetical protein